ncbi:MAG: iron ABC transporter permease [Chloroflexota bacterium]|nr:MAG: iron ABC transporter permease [Chloroflexota bacterium]
MISDAIGRGLARLSLGLFVIPLLFLAIFFFYPLVTLFARSLSISSAKQLLEQAYILNVVWFTFWQAALSTLLTLVLGLPAAYIFARYDFPGKSLLRALVTVPFVLPTVVVAASFRALLGPQGPINALMIDLFDLQRAPLRLEQTLAIILVAHIYYNMAVVIRLIGGFWANLNPRLTETARVLGASSPRAFWEVTLPLLRPPLIGASVIIFLFTFTSFGVILILGGPSFSTIETEIYRQYVTFLNPEVAAILALLQIIFTFLLMLLYAHWQRRLSVPLDFRPRKSTMRRPKGVGEKVVVGLLVVGLSIFMLSPLLALVWRSLVDRNGAFTLAYYQALPVQRQGSITFVPPLVAVRNSIGYAVLTMLLAAFLGILSAAMISRRSRWRTWLDPVFMLPLGASAVTLGFAYVLSMGRFRTSAIIVLVAHTLVALPFVVRSILPVMQGIKPSLREAAAVMGASPFRSWREIDLPIISRALLVGAVFAFMVSMGEFGATSFIVRPNSGFLTLPIAIQRYLSQPGALNFGQALAMSSILMAVCVVGFVAIERFRYADIGEF